MKDRISEHFTKAELACKCCGRCDIQPSLINALESLRSLIAKPICITSGYRCPEHNRAVGGAVNSQHIHGIAADITCSGITIQELLIAVRQIPAIKGIGVDQNFIHVDTREKPAIWAYVNHQVVPYIEAA